MSTHTSEVLDIKESSLRLLEAAFVRFNETGERLELKYQALLQETEDLRRKIEEKDREIKRREKLSTLGEMAAAIAHEVRNPLGAITLFLSLLRRDVSTQASALTLVDQIDTSVGSINHVVENILQFSRGKPLTFAPCNMHSIVQTQLALIQSRGEAQINVSLNGNPFIYGNETALRQIVHNLVLNALQAVRYQGKVQIEISDSPKAEVLLVVSDNGPGIPESMLDNIFEPFVTTKNEGTGLGLAIVQQLTAQHGGTVFATNRNGARIEVILPRHQQVREEK